MFSRLGRRLLPVASATTLASSAVCAPVECLWGPSKQESELLERVATLEAKLLSVEQREIYLAGSTAMDDDDSRRGQLRRGILFGFLLTAVAFMMVLPQLFAEADGSDVGTVEIGEPTEPPIERRPRRAALSCAQRGHARSRGIRSRPQRGDASPGV